MLHTVLFARGLCPDVTAIYKRGTITFEFLLLSVRFIICLIFALYVKYIDIFFFVRD